MIGPSTKVIESLTFLESGERAKVPASRMLSLPNAHMQLPRTCKRSALRVCALCCCFRRAFILCPCSLVVCAPGLSRCHVIHQKRNRIDSRLDVIAADAGARIVLTTSQIVSEIDSRLSHSPELATLRWVATDTLGEEDASRYREPLLCSETLGLLQYTSGSTASPKGVMLSHGNLLHNLDDLDRGWEHTRESVMVTWLPIFHDMGLIYAALLPLFKGFPCVMMPPAAFLQHLLDGCRRFRAIEAHTAPLRTLPMTYKHDDCRAAPPWI